MRQIDLAVADFKLNEYYDRALSLIVSGRAREAFNLQAESPQTRELYGRNTFGQSCLLARRLVEAGTKVVEVVWPKVANSDNHSWDHHVDLSNRMRDRSGPMLDQGLSGLLIDLDQRGLLKDTLVVAVGEFGRSPQKGVSTSGNGNSSDGLRLHWPYCYTAVVAAAAAFAAGISMASPTKLARPLCPIQSIRASCSRRFTTDSASTLAPSFYNHLPLTNRVSWSRLTR